VGTPHSTKRIQGLASEHKTGSRSLYRQRQHENVLKPATIKQDSPVYKSYSRFFTLSKIQGRENSAVLSMPPDKPVSPPDSEYELHGSHYKIGAHGFVYLWRDGEWMTSTKEKWELENPQPSTGAICHKVYGMNNEN